LNAVGATTLQPGATATFADTTFVNLPANVSNQAFAGSSATTFALSLFSVGANRFLNLELSLLRPMERQGRFQPAHHHGRPGQGFDQTGLEDSVSKVDEQRRDCGGIHRRCTQAGSDARRSPLRGTSS
jgi:hypothetical protein